MGKASTLEDFKQVASFQSLRKQLLENGEAERLERPLAYWALPGDRRLPTAFLGRPLGELLNIPYEELSATPGIGRKKLGSFLKLLRRAMKPIDGESEDGRVSIGTESRSASGRAVAVHADFDPSVVSEALWDQWRATVRRHDVGFEKLGHLAPTLVDLPTVIWQTPLSEFLDHSLAQLRQKKTYGERRVAAVLAVFHAVHAVLADSRVQSHLTLRLKPKFAVELENAIDDLLASSSEITHELAVQNVAEPLVEQVRNDCGPSVAKLAAGRLGVDGEPQHVRDQAKRVGLTRARVYQLLNEAGAAIQIRWPEGRCKLSSLHKKVKTSKAPPGGLECVYAVVELFFPSDDEKARRKQDAS